MRAGGSSQRLLSALLGLHLDYSTLAWFTRPFEAYL
jgi:hypothetical protein